jgi:cell shape-determining protein MreD
LIRYTFITVLMLLAAFIVQQFIPAFTGMFHSRVLLVHLVFLCAAVTVGSPSMLLLAFIGGFLWDAHSVIGPHGGDPEIYRQPVESIRFGTSIVLFAGLGYLMQGVQPLFRQGKWQVTAALTGIAILLYLAAEYLLINFIRGGFAFRTEVAGQMLITAGLTMLFSPVVFWLLFKASEISQHPILQLPDPKNRRKH